MGVVEVMRELVMNGRKLAVACERVTNGPKPRPSCTGSLSVWGGHQAVRLLGSLINTFFLGSASGAAASAGPCTTRLGPAVMGGGPNVHKPTDPCPRGL